MSKRRVGSVLSGTGFLSGILFGPAATGPVIGEASGSIGQRMTGLLSYLHCKLLKDQIIYIFLFQSKPGK